MSDLIERLRGHRRHPNNPNGNVFHEAADEIERLRAHIEWIGANTGSPSIALYCHKALEDK